MHQYNFLFEITLSVEYSAKGQLTLHPAPVLIAATIKPLCSAQ